MRSSVRCFILATGLCAAGFASRAMADCPPTPAPDAMVLKTPPHQSSVTVGDDLVLKPTEQAAQQAAAPKARPVKFVRPVYPACAKETSIKGVVDIAFMVEADGTVDHIEILQEVPVGFGFGEAALDAISKSKFEPATVDGKPVATVSRLRISTGPRAR